MVNGICIKSQLLWNQLQNEEFEWNRDCLKDWQEDESSTAESAELMNGTL